MPTKEEHKHAQVRKVLRELIRARYDVGDKMPSTIDLHRQMGVSQATINRAMRDLVAEGLLDRVKSRGTFVARPATGNIGFVWPTSVWPRTAIGSGGDAYDGDAYMAAIIHAVEGEAQKCDKHLLMRSMGVSDLPPFLAGERSQRVDGVILLYNYDPKVVEAYHRKSIPVVLLEPLVRVPQVPFVTIDHFGATFQATHYLAGLGHRRIVYVSLDFPSQIVPVEQRKLGYEEAMVRLGLQEFSFVHSAALGTFGGAEDVVARQPEATASFLRMLDALQITACCCYADPTAAWVLRVCHAHGMRVPDDLSVVGLDDCGLATQLSPPLTTMRQPTDEMGCAAVRMLDTLAATGTLTGPGETFPVQLVERSSTRRETSCGDHKRGALFS